MSAAEFARLWPEMVALRPQKVVFTGGEPLLRPDILDLLAGLRAADPEHHVLRCLNTNGHLVTPGVARQPVGLADEVRVSLDALPKRNDALRGEGNFEAAMRALEYYYAVGFELKVLVTITAMSLPDLEDLLCLLIEKKITRINLNGFRPIGRGTGHWEWAAQPEEVRAAVRRAWERCYPDRTMPPEPPLPETQPNCGVGSFLNIMPNGDVFPCHVLTEREFRCGNVREQSLLEICRRHGLLGQLQALDFQALAQQDERVAELTRPGTCLGNVYARTKALPVWGRSLPVLPAPRGKFHIPDNSSLNLCSSPLMVDVSYQPKRGGIDRHEIPETARSGHFNARRNGGASLPGSGCVRGDHPDREALSGLALVRLATAVAVAAAL
jgi:MoaA/NifB/PqqE/SkfB family radical SAM enzyme